MLTDSIKNSIKQMKQMESLESAAIDAERKQKNDSDYSVLVDELALTVERVHSAHADVGFQPSEETLEILSSSIEKLEEIVSFGVVDEQECQTTKQQSRKVNQALVKEWKDFYQKKTQGVGTKLSTISNLVHDKDKISDIRDAIEQSSDWLTITDRDSDNHTMSQKLSQAIYDVDHLEDELKLNEDIKDFISKVLNGTARISDVNEGIVDWINKENLQDMFVICFDE